MRVIGWLVNTNTLQQILVINRSFGSIRKAINKITVDDIMLNKLFFVVLALGAAGCGQKNNGSNTSEAWNRQNDPLNLNGEYNRVLTELPLEASIETPPWSDSYWPSSRGGLANRWKDWSSDPFTAALKTKEEVAQLTEKELALLSPAEKYDIFIGSYDYPLTSHERRRTSPDAQGWEGLCHGWAAAAANFSEPKPVLVESAEGIKIPFGSADVKALLTFLQGEYSNERTRFLGARCNVDLDTNPDAATRAECRDTNAGAFHIVISNQLGLRKESFVADVTRDLQVWNQPVHGFKSTIVSYQDPSPGAAAGTVKEAVIETTMTYTVEVGAMWDALIGTSGHSDSYESYNYRIELNANGVIIGGEWISDNRPDFLWIQKRARFSGFFRKMQSIYDASMSAAEPYPDPTRI